MKRFFLPMMVSLGCGLTMASAETFYVGTYTKPGGSEGIYRYDFDAKTGAVTEKGLAVKSLSPSFLALHPSKKYLYAVNEGGGGGASAYAVQADGTLQEINRQPTLGDGPTHITLDHEGKNALVANYGGGSVCVLPIQPDGSLAKATGFVQHKGSGPNEKRQKGPHAHSIYVDGSNKRVLAADLGVDRIFLYSFDPVRGSLEASEPPFATVAPGAGPRHLALGAKGFLYVVNEMANTVSVQAPEGNGFKEVQSISTLPEDFSGNSTTAEIFLHPNGKFLYVSNRGHDSLAIFAVGADGQLKPVGHTPSGGKSPRYFGIHASGEWLFAANQGSDNVVVFRVDPATGALTRTETELKVKQPVCVTFMGD